MFIPRTSERLIIPRNIHIFIYNTTSAILIIFENIFIQLHTHVNINIYHDTYRSLCASRE